MAFDFNKKGSAMVESAMVYPIIIFFLATIVATSYKLEKDTYDVAKENVSVVNEDLQDGSLGICNIVRGRWLLE